MKGMSHFFSSLMECLFDSFIARFSFYGMKTVLFFYLTQYLGFTEHRGTSIVHMFVMFAYFFPLIGGMLSDSVLGKFRTIFYLSLIYCIGNLLLAITAIPGVSGSPPNPSGALLGLFLLAIGTGGIKPCVSAFGGDQFHPSQTRQIQLFFSLFYFAINSGSVLSTIISPLLRKTQCFGSEDCYSAAFGLPAILMILALVIFLSGYKKYKVTPPGGNIVGLLLRVVFTALRGNKLPEETHWLDRSVPRFGQEIVDDVRKVLGVLYMFLPLPFFWTLFDQQASKWVKQAQMMDPKVWFFGAQFRIEPDQMQVTNPILILALIPIFERYIYPTLDRFGYSFKPLKRMAVGMVITGMAFLMASWLQAVIERGTFNEKDECIDNCVPIMWQVPQYIVMTAGEIMFSVTGLEFAYSQAPDSMKSVCQAAWLLTVAVGNSVVVVISEMTLFKNRSVEYLFYSILILAATLVFSMMSAGYRYSGEIVDDAGRHTSRNQEREEEIPAYEFEVDLDSSSVTAQAKKHQQ